MPTESVIHTTAFQAKARQALVLSLFDGLKEGESFIVATEEEPSMLCNKLDSFQAANLHWEYVKKGEGQWKLRIAKLDAKALAMSEKGGCCGMCGGTGHD